MTNQEIKSEILKTVSQELDEWFEKKDRIKDGYEYETEFAEMAFRLNQMMLQKSVGHLPQSRNSKKNFKLVLGGLK